MVLQKRPRYRFNGYEVPTMPRGSRSARGKPSARNKVDENRMCAFELLATVAGKLLLDKENSAAPPKATFSKANVKEEQQDELVSYKVEFCDQGSCDDSSHDSKTGFQEMAQVLTLNDCQHAYSRVGFCPCSIFVKTDPSEKVASAEESMIKRSKCEFSNCLSLAQGKFSSERHSSVSAVSYQQKGIGVPTPPQFEHRETKNGIPGSLVGTCCLEDPMEVDIKPPLVSSDEVPVRGNDASRSSSFLKCGSAMKFNVHRNDDEKSSSGLTQHLNVTSKHLRPQCIRDKRIRKLLASKFWKVGPTFLKDGDFSKIDGDRKSVFHSRKIYYMRRRSPESYFNWRKLSEGGSALTSGRPINDEGNSCSSELGIKEEASTSVGRAHGGNGTASSIAGQKISFESEDYHVKLSIKSFKVPELFIEIPETATVGSLKRTVMEAVNAIIGSSLQIGVLLQGKKVRDDNKTLLQAGISHSGTLDSLGFTLEPDPSHAPKQLTAKPEDTNFLPVCDAPEPLKRLPATPASDPDVVVESSTNPARLITSGNYAESNQNSDPASPNATASAEDNNLNSKALITIPSLNAEALAVVPKSRRYETGQRRIRRPFSVSEVEALVQAVEKLGTGRWRDVKLRAFDDDANHRTYVDLKDKWKTLVHTARISPQRRRGEPVPQDLLDRVLSAHAYWSQQQAKLQVEPPQQPEPCPLA